MGAVGGGRELGGGWVGWWLGGGRRAEFHGVLGHEVRCKCVRSAWFPVCIRMMACRRSANGPHGVQMAQTAQPGTLDLCW